jgi:transcriptional accessory protein Tex/SPT6
VGKAAFEAMVALGAAKETEEFLDREDLHPDTYRAVQTYWTQTREGTRSR